jgi:hypothetical protein
VVDDPADPVVDDPADPGVPLVDDLAVDDPAVVGESWWMIPPWWVNRGG